MKISVRSLLKRDRSGVSSDNKIERNLSCYNIKILGVLIE